jgi:hypothetical protein
MQRADSLTYSGLTSGLTYVFTIIKDEELGVRYYNLAKHSGHWHSTNLKCIKTKLKASWTEERKQKASITQSGPWTEERLSSFRSKTVGKKRTNECIQKLKSKWTTERRFAQGERLRKIVHDRFKNWKHKIRIKLSPEKYGEVRSKCASSQWEKLRNDPERLNSVRKKMSDSAKQRERKPHTEESKKKMSDLKIGKKQSIVECPHCGKVGGSATMPRWHFDNCKLKEL